MTPAQRRVHLPSLNGHNGGDLEVEAARVLDAFLADLEAGRPADPETLLAAHPNLAENLFRMQSRTLFNIIVLRSIAGSLPSPQFLHTYPPEHALGCRLLVRIESGHLLRIAQGVMFAAHSFWSEIDTCR
jgi:hypothetical protein